MIDPVRDVMARIDAIRTTIAGPTAQADQATTDADAFQTMLADALANQPLSAAIGPGRGSWTGSLTASGAPLELEHFGNGTIPENALVAISGTNERLWAPAAAAFEAMRSAAAREGVALPISDAYRTLHDQHGLAQELGLYQDGGLAAVPGTSNHGWARALDLDLDDRSQSWLRANAARFGFSETVPREPWHWEYTP